MEIRILTYNIHKCIGGVDRRFRPNRIVRTIGHYAPDVVLLQEVADRIPGIYEPLVDVLADELGFRQRCFFPNVWLRGGMVYGNAILSHFPIVETQNVNLTIGDRKPRSVVHAWLRVRPPNGRRSRTMHVFNLHIGLSGKERKRQIQRFLDSDPFARLHHRTPILVGGDFNDVWGTLGRKFLTPFGFRGSSPELQTFPAWAPVRALDALYVRGDLELTHVFRSRLAVARQASDHLPLVADARIGPL